MLWKATIVWWRNKINTYDDDDDGDDDEEEEEEEEEEEDDGGGSEKCDRVTERLVKTIGSTLSTQTWNFLPSLFLYLLAICQLLVEHTSKTMAFYLVLGCSL